MKNTITYLFVISSLQILYTVFIIVRGYSEYFKAWLKNETIWNSNYDRIRLFTNFMFFGVSFYIYNYSFSHSADFELSLFHKVSFFSIPLILGLMLYLIQMSWSKKFEITPESANSSNKLYLESNDKSKKNIQKKMTYKISQEDEPLRPYTYNEEEISIIYDNILKEVKNEDFTTILYNLEKNDLSKNEKSFATSYLQNPEITVLIFEKNKINQLIKKQVIDESIIDFIPGLLYYNIVDKFNNYLKEILKFIEEDFRSDTIKYLDEKETRFFVLKSIIKNTYLVESQYLFNSSFENFLIDFFEHYIMYLRENKYNQEIIKTLQKQINFLVVIKNKKKLTLLNIPIEKLSVLKKELENFINPIYSNSIKEINIDFIKKNFYSDNNEELERIFDLIIKKEFYSLKKMPGKIISKENGIHVSKFLFMLNNKLKHYSESDLKTLYDTGIVKVGTTGSLISNSLFRTAKMKYGLIQL